MSYGWLYYVVEWLGADIFRFLLKTHKILHLKMILSNVQIDITIVYLSLTLLLRLSLEVGFQDWVSEEVKFHFHYSCY